MYGRVGAGAAVEGGHAPAGAGGVVWAWSSRGVRGSAPSSSRGRRREGAAEVLVAEAEPGLLYRQQRRSHYADRLNQGRSPYPIHRSH
jgi:hypothetical protein